MSRSENNVPYGPEAKRNATRAIIDVPDLVGMANAAVHRAGSELEGEARGLTLKMSLHLNFLREVAELLTHEIQTSEAAPKFVVVRGGMASLPPIQLRGTERSQ